MDCFVAEFIIGPAEGGTRWLLAMTSKTKTGGNTMSKDIDELTMLNRDYVNSVQNSDVKRFDEILADEFYCSNTDRSLVDRAGFLKQSAVTVMIMNLGTNDVSIRVLVMFA